MWSGGLMSWRRSYHRKVSALPYLTNVHNTWSVGVKIHDHDRGYCHRNRDRGRDPDLDRHHDHGHDHDHDHNHDHDHDHNIDNYYEKHDDHDVIMP